MTRKSTAEAHLQKDFRATMPARLMRLMALAESLEVDCGMKLIEDGVEVYVRRDGRPYMDATLTYDSKDWEVESVEQDLEEIRSGVEAANARRKLAQAAWA